jgi:hypothetical protein
MDFTYFYMTLSAFMTGMVVILWLYIYELKMRNSDRVANLEAQLARTSWPSLINEEATGHKIPSGSL